MWLSASIWSYPVQRVVPCPMLFLASLVWVHLRATLGMWSWSVQRTDIQIQSINIHWFPGYLACTFSFHWWPGHVPYMVRTLHAPTQIFVLGPSKLSFALLTSSWRLSSAVVMLPMCWLGSTVGPMVVVKAFIVSFCNNNLFYGLRL